jgi:integrase
MTIKMRMKDGSGEVELRRYVSEDTDRHGNVRIYVRLPGKPKVRLTAPIGTIELLDQYRAAIEGRALGKQKPARSKLVTISDKASVSWLVAQYYQSAEFKQLHKSTQRVRRLILGHVCDADGAKPFKLLEPKHIRRRRDAKAETPETANGMVKALRQVYAFAIANDHMTHNPADGVPYLQREGDGIHSWTLDEVEQFEARHPVGTKARLALALMLYTGQRRSDAVLFGEGLIRDEWITFTQVKNQKRKPITLQIPILPWLRSIIDASTCGEGTFLVTKFGKPFTANGFGNWFRKRCDEAGFPHCSAHGLRKAASARLADLGASENEIRAITGHTTSKEVVRYTKAANQRLLASKAIERLSAAPKSEIIVPPFADASGGGTKTTAKPLKEKEDFQVVVPRGGIEPPTLRFSVACSTN